MEIEIAPIRRDVITRPLIIRVGEYSDYNFDALATCMKSLVSRWTAQDRVPQRTLVSGPNVSE